MTLIKAVKNALVPAGARPWKIPVGLLKGTTLSLDLRHGMQILLGLSEIELAPWFRRFSKGIRTAIDVGANEGHYTMYWLAKSSAEKVFAFEPDAGPRELLRTNLALNGLAGSSKLHLSTKFVGSADDAQHLTLDSIGVAEFPCLVKVDIEGGEMDALRGASKLIDHPQTRWIIEAHSLKLETECRALMEARGYRVRDVPRSAIRAVVPEHRPAEYNSWIVADRGD